MAKLTSTDLPQSGGISGAISDYTQQLLEGQRRVPQINESAQQTGASQRGEQLEWMKFPLAMATAQQALEHAKTKQAQEQQVFGQEQQNLQRINQFRQEMGALGNIDPTTPEGRAAFGRIAMKYADIVPEFRTLLGNVVKPEKETLDQVIAEIVKRGPRDAREAKILNDYMQNKFQDPNLARLIAAQAAQDKADKYQPAGTRTTRTPGEIDRRRAEIEREIQNQMQMLMPKALAGAPARLPIVRFLHDLILYRQLQQDPSLKEVYGDVKLPPMPEEFKGSMMQSPWLGGLRGIKPSPSQEAMANFPEYFGGGNTPARSGEWQEVAPGVQLRVKP